MRRLSLFFSFLLISLFLKAQQGTRFSVDEIFNMTIEEMLQVPITGASIYHQNLETVPGNVLIIRSEDIVNRGYSDLSDVLKDAFGFDITDNARAFGEYYRIQGIEHKMRIHL